MADDHPITQTPVQQPLTTAREHAHPGPVEYVKVGIILAIATAIEVGIYYAHLGQHLLTAMLLVLMVFKFALVVLWFMHLRFDSRLFRRLFLTGLGLAVSVYFIVLASFFWRKAVGA